MTTRHLVRPLALVVSLLFLFTLSPALSETAHPFAGGEGTAASPYEIATAQQLDSVRDYLDRSYVLTADIDLSGYENWQPIGAYAPVDMTSGDLSADLSIAFTGSFDGKGYTVSNLSIVRDDLSGEDMSGTALFGAIGGEACLQNLIIENATISSSGTCVASLVAWPCRPMRKPS